MTWSWRSVAVAWLVFGPGFVVSARRLDEQRAANHALLARRGDGTLREGSTGSPHGERVRIVGHASGTPLPAAGGRRCLASHQKVHRKVDHGRAGGVDATLCRYDEHTSFQVTDENGRSVAVRQWQALGMHIDHPPITTAAADQPLYWCGGPRGRHPGDLLDVRCVEDGDLVEVTGCLGPDGLGPCKGDTVATLASPPSLPGHDPFTGEPVVERGALVRSLLPVMGSSLLAMLILASSLPSLRRLPTPRKETS